MNSYSRSSGWSSRLTHGSSILPRPSRDGQAGVGHVEQSSSGHSHGGQSGAGGDGGTGGFGHGGQTGAGHIILARSQSTGHIVLARSQSIGQIVLARSQSTGHVEQSTSGHSHGGQSIAGGDGGTGGFGHGGQAGLGQFEQSSSGHGGHAAMPAHAHRSTSTASAQSTSPAWSRHRIKPSSLPGSTPLLTRSPAIRSLRDAAVSKLPVSIPKSGIGKPRSGCRNSSLISGLLASIFTHCPSGILPGTIRSCVGRPLTSGANG